MLDKGLELERLKQGRSPDPPVSSEVVRLKLPKFDESSDDIDAYIERFERHATSQKWPKDVWASHLSLLLSGKALQAYASLSSDCINDYGSVKKSILQRYMLTEEGYRVKFRDTCPSRDDTVSQYASLMCRHSERWIEMSGISHTFDDLKDLVLREQFLRKVHSDLRMFLKERSPKDLTQMVSFTEKYLAAHGGPMWKPIKNVKPKLDSFPSKQEVTQEQTGIQKSGQKTEKRCFLCSRVGHLAKDCVQYERVSKTRVSKDVEEKAGAFLDENSFVVLPSGEKVPLIVGSSSTGRGLDITTGFVEGQPVQVLRDTGSTGVVVKKKFVPPHLMNSSLKTVL